MKIERILALSPQERDLEIRKLIDKGPWKHRCNLGETKCRKCGRDLHYVDRWPELEDCPMPNPVPAPIPLDWNLAMKMRDECEAKNMEAYRKALKEIFHELYPRETPPSDLSFEWWLIFEVKSIHYILAAVAAGEE